MVGTDAFNALNGLTVVGFRAKFAIKDTTINPTCTVYHNVNNVKTLYEVLHLQKTNELQDVFLTNPKKILSNTDTFCFYVPLNSDESNIDDIDQSALEFYNKTNIANDETGFLASKKMTNTGYSTNGAKYSDNPYQISLIFPICVDLR